MKRRGFKIGLNFKPEGVEFTILTPSQKHLLLLLEDEFLTIKQVAEKRKTSVQAVYKIINKLKQKGLINFQRKGGFKIAKGYQTNLNPQPIVWRPHAFQWSIIPIIKSDRFEENIGKIILIDNNKIQIHRNSISVNMGRGNFFEDPNKHVALQKNVDYAYKIFTKIENDLKILILKPRKNNIKLSKWELAKVHDGIAKKVNNESMKIKITHPETGKLRIIIDKSFKRDEFEYVHQGDQMDDSYTVDRQLNDWLDNPKCPTTSELATGLVQVIGLHKYHGENLASHVDAIKTLSNKVEKFSKIVDKLQGQKELDDF